MFSVLYVTHPDEETARKLSRLLLEEKLIACANLFPIQSAYWWEGEVQTEGEWVSLLKTTSDLYPLVEQRLLKLHPYDTPCIIRTEVQANESYERWIRESVVVPDQ